MCLIFLLISYNDSYFVYIFLLNIVRFYDKMLKDMKNKKYFLLINRKNIFDNKLPLLSLCIYGVRISYSWSG